MSPFRFSTSALAALCLLALSACSPGQARSRDAKPPRGLARHAAATCTTDTFRQPDAPLPQKVDILFVMDNSESMQRHWQAVAANIGKLLGALPADQDLRIAVMLGTIERWSGRLFAAPGVPVVLDTKKYSVPQISRALKKTFAAALDETDWTGAGEALFYSVYYGATTHAQANRKLGFFRPDAALSVYFLSDDAETGYPYPHHQPWNLPPKCNFGPHEEVRKTFYVPHGIDTDSTFAALKALTGDRPLLTNAFVNITKADILVDNDPHAACIFDSPGYGYFDMVKKTNGGLFSIHQDFRKSLPDSAAILRQRLALRHDFPLSLPADQVAPSTINVTVDGATVPFTYDAGTNQVHVEQAGTFGSTVAIYYCPPTQPVPWNLSGFTGSAAQTTASLSWRTVEAPTHGRLLYGSAPDQLTQSVESADGTDHQAAVSGLQPNTLYYFQAVSWDDNGTEKRSEVLSLRTRPSWSMGALGGEASRNTASLHWSTPEYPTLGKIVYGEAPDQLSQESATGPAEYEHGVLLSGLRAGTTYYFQAVSRDEYSLEQRSNLLSLTTVADWSIVGFAGQAAHNSASFSWQTPEFPTHGRLLYGTEPGNLSASVPAQGGDRTFAAQVGGLSPDTTYFFQAVNTDDLGAEKRSPVVSLHVPASWELSSLTLSSTTSSFTVAWNSGGVPTDGLLLWGPTADALVNSLPAGNGTPEHSATATTLSPDTLYYVQAVAKDALGLEQRSPVVAVRTQAELPPPPPEWAIENWAGTPAAHEVSLHWDTSAYPTTAKVHWGLSPAELTHTSDDTASATTHNFVVNALLADTPYFFRLEAFDDQGRRQESAVLELRTLPLPPPGWKVQGLDGTTTASSATIIWQTPGASTTATLLVGLSATDLTLQKIDVPFPAPSHLAVVAGLKADTLYYFQVIAVDQDGGTVKSSVLTKRTKAAQ